MTNLKIRTKQNPIDGFESLLKVIDEELSAQERENLQASLRNLQLNFVKVFGV